MRVVLRGHKAFYGSHNAGERRFFSGDNGTAEQIVLSKDEYCIYAFAYKCWM